MKFQDTEKAENHTKTSLSTCNKDIICDDFLKLFDTGKHAPSKVSKNKQLWYFMEIICYIQLTYSAYNVCYIIKLREIKMTSL